MVEASARCRPWRKLIRAQAIRSRPAGWPMDRRTPITVEVVFVFTRPNNQFINNNPKGHRLKPTAPAYCTKRIGDIDKLSRALLDSLSDGAIYNDDSQVFQLNAYRRYANANEPASAIVTVTAAIA